MRSVKTELLWIMAGLALVVSGPVSLGSEPTEAPPAPSIVAHFHLSGMLSESPVVDPFGLTVGQVTSLAGLVERLDHARADE